ncbi:Histidine-specific methyltransferase, SAM-dependent [Fusarium oxysporum f. sp. vasinfectum]|nr:Histidine-specific methyltransferase, SAM-dependent [Fusarium oxysporum f. sp. vasinfectum]
MFNNIIKDFGGPDELEKRLEPDYLQDLALASWDFSNFALFDQTIDSPVSIPFLNTNLDIVRKQFGEKAEDVLRQKWEGIAFKAQITSLRRSSTGCTPLLEVFEFLKTLELPEKSIIESSPCPIQYFESVKFLANACYQATSIYSPLPENDYRRNVPKHSQTEKNSARFIIETLKISQNVQPLERRRLIQFELETLGCLAKLSSLGFCDMNLLEDALANLSLNHGQIKRLETNHHELSLDESLKASIYNGTDLDKRLFYIISQWVESQTSSQTQGEREIIAQLVPELADDLKAWSSPVLIEYGSGNGLKTEIILDEFEKKKDTL